MSESVVVAHDLTKEFDGLVAVDHIDFDIRPSECFGILGPNGAGKTTTIRMLYAFTPHTSGTVTVFGLDVTRFPRQIKARIGVCPQENNLDPDFTTLKNLTNFARYFGIAPREALARAEDVISFFGLQDKRNEKINNLSGGLKRRLVVARALINRPELLILDEPTTGLDPQTRHQIWDRLRELKKSGTTVLLTTHYLEEAALLCDRLIILDHGRIIEEGVPSQLVTTHIGKDVIEVAQPNPQLLEHLAASGYKFESYEERVYICSQDGDRDYRDILSRVGEADIVLRRASLEDVFLKLTGRHLRE